MSRAAFNSSNSDECLRVSSKKLSRKPLTFSGYKFVKRDLDLSDPGSIVLWLKHLEKLGNPDSLRLHYLYLLRQLLKGNPDSDDVMRLNRQVQEHLCHSSNI